jgi:2-polyprenyl-6-methoxyphenol hydroxylase-like FAD-dependent oxidoreductase
MRVFFCLYCLVLGLPLMAYNPTVIIIGGGPAGLATAIEAHEKGANVSIIEKREAYSREQRVFLTDSSLILLEKWKVDCTSLTTIDIGNGKRLGIIALNELEELLCARVQALGISRIQSEFLSIYLGKKSVRILCKEGVHDMPYDIIVAADGCHSVTRKAVGIQVSHYGHAFAVVAFVPLSHQNIGICDTIQKGDIFIKRILLPKGSLIFAQSMLRKEIPLRQVVSACGWQEESVLLDAGKARFREGIEVVLQQAVTFSDPEKEVILVGDAAACASFLDGMGANTAFLTAACAGDFFAKLQEQNSKAYEFFNAEMKKTTDELIDSSRYLFNQAPVLHE